MQNKTQMPKWQRSEYLITDIRLREDKHSCTLAGGVQTGTTSERAIWHYLLKLKAEILLDSVMPLLETHPIDIFAYKENDTDIE